MKPLLFPKSGVIDKYMKEITIDNSLNSFKEYHERRNAERKNGIINKFFPSTMGLIKREYPYYYELAKKSTELRDYCEYLSKGGREIPEERNEILERAIARNKIK